MKGKDMILSDFLSQQNNDNSNLNEIIPICLLCTKFWKVIFNHFCNDKYLIQT